MSFFFSSFGAPKPPALLVLAVIPLRVAIFVSSAQPPSAGASLACWTLQDPWSLPSRRVSRAALAALHAACRQILRRHTQEATGLGDVRQPSDEFRLVLGHCVSEATSHVLPSGDLAYARQLGLCRPAECPMLRGWSHCVPIGHKMHQSAIRGEQGEQRDHMRALGQGRW